MTEKSPKRGILSSLMGLFGDDAQAEAEQEREKAVQGERDGLEPSAPEPGGTPSSPGTEGVVRESYEPGWYAVSSARTSRPTFVSEPWGGTTLPPVDATSTAEGIQDSAPAETMKGDVDTWQRPEAPAADTVPDESAEHEPAPIYTQPYSHQPLEVPNESASVGQPSAPEQSWEEPASFQPEQPWEIPAPVQPLHSWQDEQASQPEQSWREPEPVLPEQSWQEPEPVLPEQSWQEPEPVLPEQSWQIPAPVEQEQSWHEPVEAGRPWEIPAPVEPGQTWQRPQDFPEPETHTPIEVGSVATEPQAMESRTEPDLTGVWGEPEAAPAATDDWIPEAAVMQEQAPADESVLHESAVDESASAEPEWQAPADEQDVVESPSVPMEAVAEVEALRAPRDSDVEATETAEAETTWESEPVETEVAAEPEPEAETTWEPESEPVEAEVTVEPEPEPSPEPEQEPEGVAEVPSEPGLAEVNTDAAEVQAFAATSEVEHDGHGEGFAESEKEPVAEATEANPDEEDVEDEMQAPEQALATVAASTAPDENAGMNSRVAADRRSALDEVVARGVTEDDVPAVAALLQDPERKIRVAALKALVSRADSVDAAAVRQALRDPSDKVRAGAVRLAAARAARDVPEVYAMVAERQWPATQQAALDTMPRAVRLFGIGDDDLDEVLRAIGTMETEPNAAERAGFATLGVAVGTDRLAAALDGIGDSRLGAAQLLLQEGSKESLRALAPFARDPEQEVARLGRAAFDRLGPDEEEPAEAEEEPEQPMDITEEQTGESFEAELGPQAQMVSGLARALGDPDEAVRDRAADALRTMDRSTLVGWALASMGSNDPTQVELGAQVAEAAGLTETAGELLARGSAESAEARGPFSRALASFSLSPEELVGLANDMDSQHRPEGVRMLWHIGGRSLLPAVQPLLDDSSAAVRVAALEVFGESADAQTIEVAQRVLERDSSPVVRATAISVIGRAGLDQRAASLAQALADPDPDVRATAVEVLPAGMGRQAAELLLEALADEDERVWQAAIRHLASVPDRDRSLVWQAIERCPADRREHLVATLERSSAERLALLALDHLPSPDAAERTLAITLAGRAGTPECVRGIVQSLQDPAPTVRRTAASALLTLRSGESISGLSRALSDPDVEVRVEAVRALSVIDDDNVLDALITALKDPEMRVRDVAGEALVRWRSPAVARRLAIALTNPSLRRPAGEVLARMGTSAVDPLVDILMEDDSELAGTVGHLLESLVGPDEFLTRLGSMDANDRLRAVEALGAIRGERGVDGLVRALSDPVESIRVRAVSLLGEIGDERAFEAVKQAFLSDPVLEVVSAAEEALKRLQAGQNPAAPR